VMRRIKGVLGDDSSVEERRIAGEKVYTRPESFLYKKKTYSVPRVLLKGNHKEIDEFRKKEK
jgi:tRNA (guanine37-N1)-methyltransferase